LYSIWIDESKIERYATTEEIEDYKLHVNIKKYNI